MHKLLKYNEILQQLNDLYCPISPSEVHGIACGMLAKDTAISKAIWLEEILEDDQLDNSEDDLLSQLFAQSLQQLNDTNLSFSLLLPSDNVELAKRLSAAQEWGQGLLYGTALAGLKDFAKLPDDSREFLQDVSKISSAGEFDLEDGDEDAELSYTDIVEYLRVGTLLLSEELQPSKLDTAVH